MKWPQRSQEEWHLFATLVQNFFHSSLLVFQESSYLKYFQLVDLVSQIKSGQNRKLQINLPGLLSVLPLRPPHNRTFDIRTRICFWQRDLLLLGHGLRLLAIGRLAWSSLTARFCLMRELARAAIFPPPLTFGRGVSVCFRDPLWMHLSFYQQHEEIKLRGQTSRARRAKKSGRFLTCPCVSLQ